MFILRKINGKLLSFVVGFTNIKRRTLKTNYFVAMSHTKSNKSQKFGLFTSFIVKYVVLIAQG